MQKQLINSIILKKLLLLSILLSSALFSRGQFSAVTDIDDLALIYIGSQHRPDWNEEQFLPYVKHTYPDGKSSWMFDGFLLIEFQAWNSEGKVVSFGESNSQGAQKVDLERLIKVQLGIESGNGCRALDNLIDKLIPELGEPGHKHKVVLTLPVAEAKSGDTWGSVNGKPLNLENRLDREKAMMWYIDYAMELWKQCNFKHLELDGVYWTKEAFSTDDEKHLLQYMNRYYKEKGLLVYWIPYFSASGRGKWKEFGMDVAYLQPNYYFQSTTPYSRLEEAIDYAWLNGMGLEMEFEGHAYGWNPQTGIRTRYPVANTGMYDFGNHVYYQRLVDYIDAFEDGAVFDCLPIAYYSGFQAVYEFENSGNPKDKEIIDRLARLLNQRHITTGWDSEPRAGVSDVAMPEFPIARGMRGAIYVDDRAGEDVTICTTDGKVIPVAGRKHSYGMAVPCAPGLYVVRAGDRTAKVVVR